LRWADHKRISKNVSLFCGIPELLAKQISEASILPDRNPDYEIETYVTGRRKKRIKTRKVRIKHHSQEARKRHGITYTNPERALIKKDNTWIIYLGRALHYLQDYTVSKDGHDRLEASLSKVKFPLETVKSLLVEDIHANTLKSEVYMAKPLSDPGDVFKLAVHLTAFCDNRCCYAKGTRKLGRRI